MNEAETVNRARIPADSFLSEAVSALVSADVLSLSRLADCAGSVALPTSRAEYERNHDTFAALLERTGRNLRLLRRAAEWRTADFRHFSRPGSEGAL